MSKNKGQKAANTGVQSPGASAASYLWAGALAAALGFGAVYLTGRLADNAREAPPSQQVASPGTTASPATAPSPRPSTETATTPTSASAINPLSTGHMAAFVFKKTPELLPTVSFLDATGAERTLADFKGKMVLLNLWATWCAPCRKEMPALDRLQAELGSSTFEVVAISVDRTGLEGAKKFLESIKTERLALFADPTLRLSASLKAVGMPTTLLIDKEGREIGRLVGPAEWDTEDAKRLIRGAGG